MFGGRWRLLCNGGLIVALVAAQAHGRDAALPRSPAVDLQRVADWLRQSPRDLALPVDALHENPSAGSVLRAALLAEGIAAARADLYVHQINAWARELDRLSGDPPARAAAALMLLHQRVLIRYDAQSSSVAGALERGRYNCLGSVILFAALAERLGLTCWAIERPGHVLMRLKFDGRSIDIETTWPHGVDMPQTPSAMQADERELSSRALLALVYFNRGCDLLEQQSFRPALEANLAALQLDAENTRARNNLLAAWNSWALTLARQGELQAAEELLVRGLELAPDFALFGDNLHAIAMQTAGS